MIKPRRLLTPLSGSVGWAKGRELLQRRPLCLPPLHHPKLGLSLWQGQEAGSRRQWSWEGTGGFVLSVSSQVGNVRG